MCKHSILFHGSVSLNIDGQPEIILFDQSDKGMGLGDTHNKIIDRHGRIQPIGGWGELYVDDQPTGRTARILTDGTVDYLENSGRTVMNEGLFGRLYPDQAKVEEILLSYPGITKAHAFISLVEKNMFWLTIDIETDGTVEKDALLAHIASFEDKSLMPHKVIMDGAEV